MKQKLITIILTITAILAPLLVVPNFLNANYNILKLWTLLIGDLLLIILLLCQYKNLKIDKKVYLCLFLMFVFTWSLKNILNLKKYQNF